MSKVQAYVYDITQGMAAQMSMALVGKQIDIVPHTGIVVFGKEYFFGDGPQVGEPGKTVPIKVSQILDLGETEKTSQELEAHIRSALAIEHTPSNYNLLSHNCNHYANDVAKFLLKGKGIPDNIVNVANEALSTPQGQQLRVMIEGMERSMRADTSAGGTSFNPFGSVGGGAPSVAAPAAPPAAALSASTSEPPNEDLEAALAEVASSNGVEDQRAALSTLLKITENVVKDPVEGKFRRIKMSNVAFAKKVGECAGAIEVMLSAGWVPGTTPEGEDAWLLDEGGALHQDAIKKRLAAELAKLPPLPASAAPKPAATPPAAQPAGMGGYGSMGGYGGMGGMGGMPGGLPPGGLNNPMVQQMMQNPGMMQQAQQMMQNNPQMMAQAQQMMQNPQMMQQMQQMMQDPQMMAQMQNMMGGMGRGGGGF
mmetsp:Transcript_35363/g.97601  ORF Transcript_35363/g.97601 Transcript_35363/m.97601 type:complete len:424 (-) Transcript_35363:1-1272(-)